MYTEMIFQGREGEREGGWEVDMPQRPLNTVTTSEKGGHREADGIRVFGEEAPGADLGTRVDRAVLELRQVDGVGAAVRAGRRLRLGSASLFRQEAQILPCEQLYGLHALPALSTLPSLHPLITD